MGSRPIHLNHLWLEDKSYRKRLDEDPDNLRSTKCKLCLRSIQLSSMGKRALDKHVATNNSGKNVSVFSVLSSQEMSVFLTLHSLGHP